MHIENFERSRSLSLIYRLLADSAEKSQTDLSVQKFYDSIMTSNLVNVDLDQQNLHRAMQFKRNNVDSKKKNDNFENQMALSNNSHKLQRDQKHFVPFQQMQSLRKLIN